MRSMRRKNFYKGQMLTAAHLFTKGKRTEDVILLIEVLEGMLAFYRSILTKRNYGA